MKQIRGLLWQRDSIVECRARVQLTKLVTKMRWKLLLNCAGHVWPHMNVALHIERHLELLNRIILSNTLVLPNTQPACLYKLHPAIVSEAGRNECFHLFSD